MTIDPAPVLEAVGLRKGFTIHAQGARLDVLNKVDLTVSPGECVVLDAPSGRGKSTLLRALYGNYRIDGGHIFVRHRRERIDLAAAPERELLEVRRETIGFVSQFLRVIPRVATLEIVAEPLRQRGIAARRALDRAAELLAALAVPQRLWDLAPATFSGGEQQRVNIARALIADHPILLLDEPTSALDADNRALVLRELASRRAKGAAMIGIFHDLDARQAIATRLFSLSNKAAAHV